MSADARNVNTVRLVGTVIGTPELNHTTTGNPCTTFMVVTKTHYHESDKEEREILEYHTVKAYSRMAEKACETIGGGDIVEILGALETKKWLTKDRERRRCTSVKAKFITVISKGIGIISKEAPEEDEVQL